MTIKKDSKTILYEAFYELAKRKPLEDITVQDILDCSGISRSTFYRHFADKYEIMSWAYTSQSNDMFFNQYDGTQSLVNLQYEISLQAAYNYYKHGDYFSCVAKYDGQNSLSKASYRNGVIYYKAMLEKGGIENISDELMFAIKFYAFGATHMLLDWMENGFRYSPEEHVQYLQAAMPTVLREAIIEIDRKHGIIEE